MRRGNSIDLRAGMGMFVEFAFGHIYLSIFKSTHSMAIPYPRARVKTCVLSIMRFQHLLRCACSIDVQVATIPSDDFDGLVIAKFVANGAAKDTSATSHDNDVATCHATSHQLVNMTHSFDWSY